MHRVLHRSLPLVAIALASCSPLDALGVDHRRTAAAAGAALRTDSAVYHVRTGEYAHEVSMGLTYTNWTGRRLHVSTCHTPAPPTLQKWVAGEWVTAYSPATLLCAGHPVVIEPRRRYELSYHVLAMLRPNHYPRLEVAEIPGTYRLLWHAVYAPDGSEISIDDRISNTFELRM